ncbi:MAG: hypothetical protein ACRDZ5_02925 [Acidimicrobiales bacterium]
MTGAVYDVVLIAHVAAAVVGFGAIGAGGVEAANGRHSPNPARDLSLRRFFRPGRDWAAAVIFIVPLIGLGLLFGGDRGDASRAWPWIGLCIWTAAAALATGVLWPAERRAQRFLAALVAPEEEGHLDGPGPERRAPEPSPSRAPEPSPDRPGYYLDGFRQACAVMERAAGAISLLFLAAVAIMIVQP